MCWDVGGSYGLLHFRRGELVAEVEVARVQDGRNGTTYTSVFGPDADKKTLRKMPENTATSASY